MLCTTTKAPAAFSDPALKPAALRRPDPEQQRREAISQRIALIAEILALVACWESGEIKKLADCAYSDKQPPHQPPVLVDRLNLSGRSREWSRLKGVLCSMSNGQLHGWRNVVRDADAQPSPFARVRELAEGREFGTAVRS